MFPDTISIGENDYTKEEFNCVMEGLRIRAIKHIIERKGLGIREAKDYLPPLSLFLGKAHYETCSHCGGTGRALVNE